jgi:hypothetical protein
MAMEGQAEPLVFKGWDPQRPERETVRDILSYLLVEANRFFDQCPSLGTDQRQESTLVDA